MSNQETDKSQITFATEKEAEEWMEREVDDPYIDNYRFAFLDDDAAMTQYIETESHGCCGSFDREIYIGDRKAKIGCNYGH